MRKFLTDTKDIHDESLRVEVEAHMSAIYTAQKAIMEISRHMRDNSSSLNAAAATECGSKMLHLAQSTFEHFKFFENKPDVITTSMARYLKIVQNEVGYNSPEFATVLASKA